LPQPDIVTPSRIPLSVRSDSDWTSFARSEIAVRGRVDGSPSPPLPFSTLPFWTIPFSMSEEQCDQPVEELLSRARRECLADLSFEKSGIRWGRHSCLPEFFNRLSEEEFFLKA